MLSRAVSPLALLFGVLVPDLVLSVIAAIITRRIAPLRFAPFFPLMRFVDAAVCLRSLVETYVRPRVASGRWTSPARRPRHLAGTGASADGHPWRPRCRRRGFRAQLVRSAASGLASGEASSARIEIRCARELTPMRW